MATKQIIVLDGTQLAEAIPTIDNVTGNLAAPQFIGGGGSLTNLNATQLTTGTIPAARMSGVVLTTTDQSVGGNKTFTGSLIAPNLVYLTGAQTISGAKTFTIAPRIQSTQPQLEFEETDTAKVWKMFISADIFYLRNDANANILTATAAGVLTGNGSGLTALNASALATGEITNKDRINEAVVRDRIAVGAVSGAIGTYAFLGRVNNGAMPWGTEFAGSGLSPAGMVQNGTTVSIYWTGSGLSGTWKVMGATIAATQGTVTLCVRIA